jgi:biotin carboxylase
VVGVTASRAADRDKRLLVLGAGPAQLGLLRAARERGLFVIACDRDPEALGFEFADRRAIVSAEDEAAITALAKAESVDGLVAPGIDWPVAIAARVAGRLGLPHPLAPEVAALCVSKQRQRERLAEHGVPQPGWKVTSAVTADLPVPCVVKPPDRQGQKGLTLVRDRDELADAVALAVAESRAGLALVEELIEGPEVTVNAFSVRDELIPLTVTDRLTAEPPAFGVALAHAWPSDVPGWENAVTVVSEAVRALGIADGPTYTQVRFGPDGPRVMEVAARLGGGHDAELCAVALGVDLNGLAISAAFGEGVDVVADPAAVRPGGACVRFLVPPEGTLSAVEGLDEAVQVEGVIDARVYRRPGFRFGPFRRGADRAGFVLAAGDSKADALARADRAAALIRFETADVEARIQA